MEKYLKLLKDRESKNVHDVMTSIRVFSDGSGRLLDGIDEEIFEFNNIKDLEEKLKNS
jgi:hypothetical protein